MLLAHFEVIRPRHETAQEKGLEWFIAAHIQAEKTKGMPEKDLLQFSEQIRERIGRFCCKADRIAKRGHVLGDFLHHDWNEMEIYRLRESAPGLGLKSRIDFYKKEVDAIFEQYYLETKIPPDDLIHVTCTGYVSPSGAQKVVSKKNWGGSTTVTHAYHMGCYGALPAIRMGMGFLNTSEKKQRSDIVHTEISSIHSNPARHEADQLVTQSLFADGFIKYSILKQSKEPHFKVHEVLEEIIPHSTEAMTWDLSDWNFALSLAKEVPVLIVRALSGFLQNLVGKRSFENALFAIHPGGPKIVDQTQQLLGLKEGQVAHSQQVMKKYGNMSSATLPHIWDEILRDSTIQEGTPIVSLAFGPGLSIAGAFMEKRCGG